MHLSLLVIAVHVFQTSFMLLSVRGFDKNISSIISIINSLIYERLFLNCSFIS